jgi:hypothetical protein
VNVDGVGRAAPGLELLGHFLGVRGGEHAHLGGVFKRVGKMVEQCRHSIGETDGGEDAGSQKRVATEGVEKRVVRAGDI